MIILKLIQPLFAWEKTGILMKIKKGKTNTVILVQLLKEYWIYPKPPFGISTHTLSHTLLFFLLLMTSQAHASMLNAPPCFCNHPNSHKQHGTTLLIKLTC